MKRSVCGMIQEHIPHETEKWHCSGTLSIDISENPCPHAQDGDDHAAHTWNDRHDVYWCANPLAETDNPVQQHISTIGNFSVCTRCGVLIAEEFGAVHDRYHSEPRTITVQLPSL